jgi:hypothetical protein
MSTNTPHQADSWYLEANQKILLSHLMLSFLDPENIMDAVQASRMVCAKLIFDSLILNWKLRKEWKSTYGNTNLQDHFGSSETTVIRNDKSTQIPSAIWVLKQRI